jgi:hypothetical protein
LGAELREVATGKIYQGWQLHSNLVPGRVKPNNVKIQILKKI